jgi:hypothetical protein
VRAVAAGADDVDRVVTLLLGERHQIGRLEDRVEQSGQLLRALALGAERHGERDQLRRSRVAGQDRRHRHPGLLSGEVVAVEQQPDERGPSPVIGEIRHRRGRRAQM